jgi:hypothetical protein
VSRHPGVRISLIRPPGSSRVNPFLSGVVIVKALEIVFGGMLLLAMGCSGGPDPALDEPPPAQTESMTEEQIQAESAIGKPPVE